MRRQVTLFQYLYDTLTMQIRTEKIRYGESLPSIRQLCGLYNVGIRTVKDVLKALSDEGYIKTEVRKNAVVIYKNDPDADPHQPVELLLARKGAVIDMLLGMACLFPHIIASGAMLCNKDCLDAFRKMAKGIETKAPKEKWRIGSAMVQKIVSFHNSALLTDLFIDMDMYGQVPVFGGLENPFRSLTLDEEKGIAHVFELMETKDYDHIYACTEKMYNRAVEYVSKYLDDLSAAYPQYANVAETSFAWDAKKGRVFSYMEISRKIITKIGKGIYENNTLIPNIAELTKEYKASPTTIGKSLSVLNGLGLLQTVNGRGSLVTLDAAKTIDIHLKDAGMKMDANTFLCAIQLVALTCKTVVLLGFDQLPPETIGKLEEEVNDPRNLALPYNFIASMVQVQPYDSIKVIYEQLGILLSWGYYFAFAKTDDTHYQNIRAQCKKAIAYLARGEKYAFSDIVQDIYIDIFVTMKGILVGYGANESAGLAVPQPDTFSGPRIMAP